MARLPRLPSGRRRSRPPATAPHGTAACWVLPAAVARLPQHLMARHVRLLCLLQAQRGNTVILMGHNGPTGLGASRADPCGVDFRWAGGLLSQPCWVGRAGQGEGGGGACLAPVWPAPVRARLCWADQLLHMCLSGCCWADQLLHMCLLGCRSDQGDHGDPDLAAALEQLAAGGVPVACVVFGHMHHSLRGAGMRAGARPGGGAQAGRDGVRRAPSLAAHFVRAG
jgi:hypothetical protein